MHCEITIPTDAICALRKNFEVKQSVHYIEINSEVRQYSFMLGMENTRFLPFNKCYFDI